MFADPILRGPYGKCLFMWKNQFLKQSNMKGLHKKQPLHDWGMEYT